MSIKYLTLASLFVGSIRTALVPTAPSGGQIFDVNSVCPYQYNIDQTGIWNNVTIQLMTGDNFNMIPVTTVAVGVDGTKGNGSSSWVCPSVLPNSAIYFYQFTINGPTLNPTWTTRFTIASSSGSTTPPTNMTQPGGAAIPWGVGKLVNAAANSTVSTSTSTSSSSSSTSSTVRPTTTSNSTTMVTSTSFSSTGTSISPSATSTKSSSPSERKVTISGLVFVVLTLALIV